MSRPRHDPRAEREARRLPTDGNRPRFSLAPLVVVPAPTSGRPRRDPRAERDSVLVPGLARPRLDRAPTAARATAALPATAPEARVETVSIAEPAFLVLAVAEAEGGRLSRHERQVLGAARRLVDAGGGAVVLAAPALAEDAGMAGADRLLMLDPSWPCDPEGTTALLAALARAAVPRHLLFAENDSGADLARRLAAALGEPLSPAVEALSPRELVHPCRAGRSERRLAPPRIISLAPDRVAPYAGPHHEVLPFARPETAADTAPRRKGILSAAPLAVEAARLPLGEAPFVTAAGNGVTDFPGFLRLCRALGATPGASRVVCDAGAMPRAAQVGASGTVLDALAYLAFGIAGAPQHLQGLGRVEHVAAVNTDIHAAMIARAELAIVQDAQKVMPALIALMEGDG